MRKLKIYRRESKNLKGRDLKISLSRRITSETAQLNYLMANKPTSQETIEQLYLLSQLKGWRKSLD